MLDISWGELLIIGGVALVVIGPKDLPKALRTLGSMTSKLRRMAGEFRSQFDEAMREAEMADIRKDLGDLDRTVAGATRFDPIGTLRDEIKGAVEGCPTPAATTFEAAMTHPVPPAPEPVIEVHHPQVPDLPPELLAPAPVTDVAHAPAHLAGAALLADPVPAPADAPAPTAPPAAGPRT